MALTKVHDSLLNDGPGALGFGPNAVVKNNQNYNDLKDNGVFLVAATGSTNGPKGNGVGGIVHVIRTPNSTYIRQMYYATTTAEVWTRHWNSDAWSTWVCLYAPGATTNTNTGYQTLPSGIILQWGFDNSAVANPATVTFPIPFPTACVNTQATCYSNTGAKVFAVSGLKSASSAEFHRYTDAGSASTAPFHWFAVGY